MEDTHIHLDETNHESPAFKRVAYYGVYDGHGGITTADIVAEILHTQIFATPEFLEGKPEEALNQGFQIVDKIVVERANAEGWMNGTTAVVGMVVDGTLYIANVGDAEACLVSVDGSNTVGEVLELTYPHKASDADEKQRIEDLGGHVFFGRVFGSLAVARAFGDSRYKQPKTSQNFVSVEPFLKSVTLSTSHKYIILACDGLWDVCSHDEAAKFVHNAFVSGKNASEVSVALVQHALDLRTDDNVTAVVVKIDWEDGDAPASSGAVEEQKVEAQAAPATPPAEETASAPAAVEESKTGESEETKTDNKDGGTPDVEMTKEENTENKTETV